jgi:hypothetical protein
MNRTAFVAAMAFVIVIVAGGALAQSARGPGDIILEIHRWLWPHQDVPLPRPRPAQEVALPPAVPPPSAQAQPETKPAPSPQPQPATASKPARRMTKRPDDGGPDLPWPCWMVRLHAAGKTPAQLEAEGRKNGITLTPKQRRQAQACLNGK